MEQIYFPGVMRPEPEVITRLCLAPRRRTVRILPLLPLYYFTTKRGTTSNLLCRCR